MASFDIGDWTVHPAVRGAGDQWIGCYSITTRVGVEPPHRYPVIDVDGTFRTEDEAMQAARLAGRLIAEGFDRQDNVEAYCDHDAG